MTIAVRLFLSSMVFALVIAGAYYWATHDIIGTILLCMMALAMICVLIYILVAERESDLASDAPTATPSDVVGEIMGTFTLESYWPIVSALGTALLLMGVVFLPGPSTVTTLVAGAILFFAVHFLIREST